ncbi:PD40 domain-containing protein [bacterium]|nr:PD40 domain-containing protein [bacterium]
MLVRKYIYIIILTALSFAVKIQAQPEDYPHPNLKWYTIESEHFFAHYHEGAERAAKTCVKIGEDIYEPITKLYGYEPDTKIHFLIKDTDDYSNGGAYYYDNKILIWATALDWDLRGTHNWLRNVVTHEFSHMIQLGASRKLPRRFPGIYLQWLNYEEEKRPDVLYGYPNVLMSYPIAMTVIPPWFAEGCAQSQAPGFDYDTWDSHRDMILRTRALTGTLLSLNEMGAYGKNTVGNESVYNQGYSLTQYIIKRWGDDALQRISANMKAPLNYSFSNAIEKAIGLTDKQLYKAWKDSLEKYYTETTASISKSLYTGAKIGTEGYGNFYPAFINDIEIVYLSNKGRDYMSITSLYKMDLTTGKSELLKSGVQSRPAVSPDGEWLAYSRKTVTHRAHLNDLYLFNLADEKEYRMTTGARAESPAFSPDGKSIAFVLNWGGTKNLAVAELPELTGKNIPQIESWRIITDFNDGEQIYNPVYSPDDSSIVFAFSDRFSRDIGEISTEGGKINWILNSEADERNPSFTPDGKGLLYSSDKTGIYNLYRLDLASGEETLLTNVLGGAFMGNMSDSGMLVYSGYCDNGYYIYLINTPEPQNSKFALYERDFEQNIPIPQFNDHHLPDYKIDRYKPAFGITFLLPRLMVDLSSFKPGLYFYKTDFLDWFNLFGGFSFNGITEDPKFWYGVTHLNMNYLGDYDMFAMIEYVNINPTIFLEGYNVVRNSEQTFLNDIGGGARIIGETPEHEPIYDDYAIDYKFSLNEVDGGFRYQLNDKDNLELRGIISRYNSKLTFDDGAVFNYYYFKGKSLALRWRSDQRIPAMDMDINPRMGRQVIAEIARENNDFIDGFTVDAGLIKEVYIPYNYGRYSLQWEEYLKSPLGDMHGITLRANAAFLDQNNVDDFFYLYGGGLPGMKGYSFYSLGGTRNFIGTLTYRFPLLCRGGPRILQAYLQRAYLGLFMDYGNAWTGDVDFADWKKDIGVNLRMQLVSFFAFPTAVTLEAAYGLDKFSVSQQGFEGTYGKEWRYYLTVLFNFNMMQRGRTVRNIGF